jgi:ABC-type Mn2+/Zn2+ transport system permease subunit
VDSFWLVVSFSAVPLVTALLFAAITPPLGASLYLRNEVLLGIALPPAGSAVVALAVALNVPAEAHTVLYLITMATLFGLMLVLPLGTGKQQVSIRRREIILAVTFVLGNTLTVLFMALSPHAESHLKHFLSGEILSITRGELGFSLVLGIFLLIFGFAYRGVLFAFCLDEEGFKIKTERYNAVKIFYRLAATLIVTGGIILIGPILCTALLILPALFGEKAARSLEGYIAWSIAIGFSGTLCGFLLSILLDLPPSYVASCAIFLSGMAVVGFRRFSGKAE